MMPAVFEARYGWRTCNECRKPLGPGEVHTDATGVRSWCAEHCPDDRCKA